MLQLQNHYIICCHYVFKAYKTQQGKKVIQIFTAIFLILMWGKRKFILDYAGINLFHKYPIDKIKCIQIVVMIQNISRNENLNDFSIQTLF